ncbi:4-hydroxyphenylpyruvate dioxygenase [Lentzea sp. NBRC 105346]|uniref:4-hydroxyphenylpyruvate dioxygenase n=1 Tax=Lentzea sp. NBRC 105346 TaxID=3032205 RepID=UPI0024A1A02C|nr:4-hydroxyphenylpyruvate dioxygenase [Lentzea sp. NBRC 105346]GLZ31987.1 4-hydroxyphenylpyruvate dioxygenase [Lentzea sp. NBRC 105346]
MDRSRLSHVHLYVGDACQAAYFYRKAFGFRPIAESPAARQPYTVLLAQGDIRLMLTSTTNAADPVARYVAAHGDGVADIAIAVPDVAQAFRAAVERGADPIMEPSARTGTGCTVVSATVRGFGDVVHTLVEAGTPLPHPTLSPIDGALGAPSDGELLRAIDHFAVCVPTGELDKTVSRYQEAFGFDEVFSEFIEVGEQAMSSKVVRHPSSGITLTILEPDASHEPGQIDTFLLSHGGAGVQHVAFETGDIREGVRRIGAQGVEFLKTPAAYYDLVEDRVGELGAELDDLRARGILADRDEWGLLLQIFTRSPYARRTLFLELIERRGARTFGSGNIKGLYEAVEREQSREDGADAV